MSRECTKDSIATHPLHEKRVLLQITSLRYAPPNNTYSDDPPARHFTQWPIRSAPRHLQVPGTHKWLPAWETYYTRIGLVGKAKAAAGLALPMP